MKNPFSQLSLKLAFLSVGLACTVTGCLQTRTGTKEQDEKVVLRNQVKQIQQNTADVNSRFQDIDDEFRRVNGRLETVEARMQQFGKENATKGTVSDARLKEMGDRLLVYQDALSKLGEQVAQLNVQVSEMQESMKRDAQAAAAERATAKEKSPMEVADDHFDKKQWKEAILNYERFRKGNPKSKLYSTATYKMGLSFQELGLTDDAKAFFEEVVNKYPKSSEATKAQQRLKSMKR